MISLPVLSLCVMAGLSPLLFLPSLPGIAQIAVITIASTLMLFLRHSAVRFLALALLFFCWGLLAARQVTLPYDLLTTKTHQVEAVITGTDGATESACHQNAYRSVRVVRAAALRQAMDALAGMDVLRRGHPVF